MKLTIRNILTILISTILSGTAFNGKLNAQQLSALPFNPVVANQAGKVTVPQKAAVTLELPFFDDFSAAGIFPDQNKWQDASTYISNSLPLNPPSFNVAVFDIYNAQGRVYNKGSKGIIGDTLTSQVFDLSASALDDSVYLSFYYQVGGKAGLLPITIYVRDTINSDSTWPEGARKVVEYGAELDSVIILTPKDTTASAYVFSEKDSLLIEFYHTDSARWERVGGLTEQGVEQSFKSFIAQVQPTYFGTDFQFRIINKLYYDDLDVYTKRPPWMVDYIRLEKADRANMLQVNDLAISNTPPFIFEGGLYSIPWSHLEVAQGDKFFKSNIPISLRNNLGEEMSIDKIEYQISELNSGKEWLGGERFGQSFDSQFKNITLGKSYTFEYVSQDTGIFQVDYSFLSSNDVHQENNKFTARYESSNYYAYDDGTPELMVNYGAYGSWIGSRFYSHKQDTLRAVDIYFTPAVNNLTEDKSFEIWVWRMKERDSVPVFDDPIYVSQRFDIKYKKEYGFGRYYLEPEEPIIIEGDAKDFIVGIRQFFAYENGIGIDMSNNSNNTVALNEVISGDHNRGWARVNVYGNLMIRPVMGKYFDAPTAINKTASNTDLSINAYPSPASDVLYINVNSTYTDYSVSLYNLMGQEILYTTQTESIQVTDLPEGIYMVKVVTSDNKTSTQKILIAH